MTDQRELVAHPRGTERPYSRAAVFAGTIWACGQIPTTADGQTPAAIGDQVKVALDNLEATLLASGGGLHTLLKTTVYLADLAEFDEYNAAYLDRLEGIPLPPRTTVEVARFRGSKRIEIDAVAAVYQRIDKREA
ncbi:MULTISPECIES: RidA family protein [Rhodococcus]|uniref:YjgF/YER057c/UK114 family protein n=1 Tax=Rhodococcus opacus RKJ300 = JCM 13270 TaxID=1165867 RepID=I0W9Q2_RHOOP|nr:MULTISPECIES: RidA family protein [Rhodococcus]EID73118.1 YjgF/YER057c/UK114 family protein [Rhodococcus opacus RKJ300 = JCM 13270]QQZ13292.1 RidA family protein [Rhodococcus sp. 21391]